MKPAACLAGLALGAAAALPAQALAPFDVEAGLSFEVISLTGGATTVVSPPPENVFDDIEAGAAEAGLVNDSTVSSDLVAADVGASGVSDFPAGAASATSSFTIGLIEFQNADQFDETTVAIDWSWAAEALVSDRGPGARAGPGRLFHRHPRPRPPRQRLHP